MIWQRVCGTADVPVKGMKQFTAEGGSALLVLSSGSEYYACQAVCPHMDTPLEEGTFDGTTLTCDLHLWQWDIENGDPKGLAELPLERFDVKIESGAIFVQIDEREPRR